MATAIHPHFKLVVIKNITSSEQFDNVLKTLASELLVLSSKESVQYAETEEPAEEDQFLQV